MLSLLLCSLLVTDPATASTDVLAKIRQGVLDNLRRLPNYTCTETIERSYRPSASGSFQNLDRVRLEIAYVGGKELFGWPGGDRFAEDDLGRLVGGTITNGDFALLTRALVTNRSILFGEIREESYAGRATLACDFTTPRESSDWILSVAGQAAPIGHHGTLWVDAGSLQLLAVRMSADDVPSDLGYKAITRELQFQSARIGSADFLLPSRADLQTTQVNGAEAANETRFRDCRQYTVQSVISFDPSGAGDQGAALAQNAEVALPEQFDAHLVLDSTIDSDTSAVGDPITAHLDQSIRSKRQVVIPKGAIFHGRIMRLEVIDGRRNCELAFTHFEARGERLDLAHRRNEVVTVTRRISGSQRAAAVPWSPESPVTETIRSAGPIQAYGARLVLSPGFAFLLKSTAERK